ncbi:MAG: 16S rRNA (adenine(1518)-N(6)/adenine(1519)-N(6))-dimethyltransferase RsmA [Pirellulales bacterium]|nr:16S rRNA (adenine(1518)-N(6)/adenine(1519)-N(6))-dimethyltransferase RsmA [Pirellulales bacterium]
MRPRTRVGQNFLIDLNLLDVLVESAAVEPDDVVLEVGTGTGSLTAMLATRAAAVVTVEVDHRMFQLAAEQLHRFDNVTMLQVDALKNKNRLNPAVLEAMDAQLAKGDRSDLPRSGPEGALHKSDLSPSRRLKLVANLPYNIATPLLSNLLTLDDPPRTMTVTIQKELAQRITARPGNKDFSALSAWIQSQCRVEILRILPPGVFWPRPKVSSAFIQITLDDELRRRIPDRKFFHDFVRAMFIHRRKFLRSQLLSAVKGRLGKPEVDDVLARLDLDGTLRAEQLDVETLLAMCEAVRT